jgi:hypothetical protein
MHVPYRLSQPRWFSFKLARFFFVQFFSLSVISYQLSVINTLISIDFNVSQTQKSHEQWMFSFIFFSKVHQFICHFSAT